MGLRSLGLDPVKWAREAVNAPAENIRRQNSRRRRRMYEDDLASVLRGDIERVVQDRTRRDRIGDFVRMASSVNLFKRIVNDIASPVYAQSPTRRAESKSSEDTINTLADECRLNAKHDLALRLCEAQGAAGLFYRYVPRLMRVVVDVIPIDSLTVIPDPDDPTREIAIMYDRSVKRVRNGTVIDTYERCYWDDEIAFVLDENANVVPQTLNAEPRVFLDGADHPGILPIVMVHRNERASRYWDETTGDDLVNAQSAISFLQAMALRLVKVQGHTQLALNGDPATFPKGQVLDPEVPIIAGEGNTLSPIHNPTDAGAFLRVAESITLGAGANYGMSRELLNAQVRTEADMVSLLERRQQVTKRAADLEQASFRVLKVISKAHDDPSKRISDGASLSVDFAEYTHKVDRKALLEIWDMEIRKGLRSVYDCIRADNPEIKNDDEARAEITRNLESYSWLVETLRARNITINADAAEPGQDPRVNGAMGPAVRDGDMTKDEASEQARTGRPDPDQ